MILLPNFVYALLLIASPLALASGESSVPPSATVTTLAAQPENIESVSSEVAEPILVEPVVESDGEPEVETTTEPAQEKAAIVTNAMSGTPAGTGINDLLQVIFSFSLVIGVLMFMLWAIKRWQPNLATARGGLSVKAALSLGGRDRLVVVQAGERQILLGVSPGNITLLGDYDELLPSAPLPAEKVPSSSAVDAFQKLLKR